MGGVDDLRDAVTLWLEDVLGQLECSSVGQLSPAICGKPVKNIIATWLCSSLSYVSQQNDVISDLRSETEALKTELIGSQQRVIRLQEELLSSKNEQLQSLQTTVKTSVEDTVKAEFVTYSAQVQKTQPQSITPETVKSVVRTVVEEEDRSRSVMVFGLPEEDDEQLNAKISEVFQEIGEKPRIEASRLGKECKQRKVRPVKVTLTSSAIVNQILVKARKLKQSENNSSVFICPDRSPVQRARHRELVKELKEKPKDSTKRHFIRGGKICSSSIT